MKNTHLRIAVGLFTVSAVAFFACKKENASSGGPAKASIYLTDHQTPVFDSVFIDIQKLEVKIGDSNSTNEGWIDLAINPGVYNILRFRNGLDTLFASGTLPSNRLRKIRMTLGTQNRVVKNGQSFPLKIKDTDKQVVANLSDTNFDITGNQVFFWIDFDAGNSIVVDNSGSGNNNGYALKAHIKIFTKTKSGRIEGRVLPFAADAIIKAVNGSDTATAIPDDHDGEFRIVGLNAGTYSLIIDAQNGYQDTTINNIVVRNGEDTHLPLITLHQ